MLDAADKIRSSCTLHVVASKPGGLLVRGIHLGDHRDEPAIAVLRMRMAELELPPLWVSILGPSTIAAGQRENVGPSDGLLAIADCFGHWLPHRNYHR